MEDPSKEERELADWLQSVTNAQMAWAALFVVVAARFDAATAIAACLVVYLLRVDG